MKRFAIATLASAFMASSAYAADLYTPMPEPAPLPTWQGFYLGASGGYGWGNTNLKFQNNGYESNVEGTLLDDAPVEWYSVSGCESGVGGWGGLIDYCGSSSDPDGGFLGGQIGYNFQVDSMVWGIEADAFASGISGGASQDWSYDYGGADYGSTQTDIDTKIKAFGTVRGRLGLASMGALMPYVTGGLAWASVKTSVDSYNINNNVPDTWLQGSDTSSQWGWTVGGGFEYMIADGVSLKAEYLYMDLGSVKSNFAYNDDGPYSLKTKLDVHTIKGGINVHF